MPEMLRALRAELSTAAEEEAQYMVENEVRTVSTVTHIAAHINNECLGILSTAW